MFRLYSYPALPGRGQVRVYTGVYYSYDRGAADAFRAARSCVNVEVAALGSPSLIVLTISVDVKQH